MLLVNKYSEIKTVKLLIVLGPFNSGLKCGKA